MEIKSISCNSSLQAEEVASLLDNEGIEWQTIGNVNWKAYPYRPDAKFRIAHGCDCFVVQYLVNEETIRARYGEDNGQVWTDSCAEFFIQPTPMPIYYNIECNCIGTILLGCGEGRQGRELASTEITARIKRFATLGRQPFEERQANGSWSVSLVIPTSTFFRSQLPDDLSGLKMRGNFYKCGDELQQMHFLSWNPILLPSPDFHCPRFFGELNIE